MEEFRKAIELDPRFSVAHSNLGFIYAQMGHMDKAESEYKTAIRLDPSDSEPRIKLGQAYLKTGKIDNAVSTLEEALRLAPGHQAGARLLAEALSINNSGSGGRK